MNSRGSSWRDSVKMNSHQGLYREIPRKLLVDEVRRIGHQLSKPPTMVEFDRYSKIGRSVTCSKKFHGWTQFLIQAGFNPTATRSRIPDDELQEEFRKICDLLGHTPTTEEFNKYELKAYSSGNHRSARAPSCSSVRTA